MTGGAAALSVQIVFFADSVSRTLVVLTGAQTLTCPVYMAADGADKPTRGRLRTLLSTCGFIKRGQRIESWSIEGDTLTIKLAG